MAVVGLDPLVWLRDPHCNIEKLGLLVSIDPTPQLSHHNQIEVQARSALYDLWYLGIVLLPAIQHQGLPSSLVIKPLLPGIALDTPDV